MVKSGGVYVNGRRVLPNDLNERLKESDVKEGKVVVFRAGKGNYKLLSLLP